MKHHLFGDSSRGLNFVAIGGGNGLSTLLSGLKRYVQAEDDEPVWLRQLSAIVADVRLAADLKDGSIVRGETNISKVGHNIARLYLEPSDCRPMPEALAAIHSADVITIGPGSLYTSLLPPILVEGVADAIAA